jgi:F-type H+-transporting ATPase subunit b
MNSLLSLAVQTASEASSTTEAVKDPPIIDLDSTIFLQLAIFIIAALILSRFLFRPYLQVKAARATGIEGAKEEARRMDEEAAARMADYESSVAKARAKANAERGKLQAEAVGRDHEIIEAARTATQASLDEARKKLEADADVARKQLEPRAEEIARSIAKKILGREVA